MKKFPLLLLAPVFAFALAALPAVAAPSHGHGPDTELAREMKNIGKNVKTLRRTIADPAKKDEVLADLAQMIQSAEKAKTLTPKKESEIPEAQRGQFNKDFQEQIDGLIAEFKKIQAAVQDGKTAEAQAEFGKIGGMKRDGHEKFAADEHEHTP